MKILIADKLAKAAVEKLVTSGFQVTEAPDLKDQALTQALASLQPQALVVRSTKVTEEMCHASDALELIIRAGAGVNNIDIDAASKNAIFVSNCPGMNAVAVAELVVAHLLNADRRIAENIQSSREGIWRKKTFSSAIGLAGKRIGLVGFGAIAQAVAARARGLAMEVVAWSATMDEETAHKHKIKWCDSLESLAMICDVVSIHLPLNDGTRNLIDARFFKSLRSNAIFINTARAEVVDEKALERALDQGGLRACLDVISDEPKVDGEFVHPLSGRSDVYLTHHIGASTQQAQQAVADEVVRIAVDFRDSGSARNCVNRAKKTQATHLLIIRHQDKVGVLATILDLLRGSSINVQGMSNEIFQGERAAACARIQISTAPSLKVSAQIRDLADVISYTIVSV